MKMKSIKEWLSVRAERARQNNFTCDICEREVFENERVCKRCKEGLPANDGPVCPVCGRALPEGGFCLDCKDEPLEVLCARSAYRYEGEVSRLVVRFKRNRKYLARTFAELSVHRLMKEFSDADALAFVPMTAKAEKKRGYNQSRLFAEALSPLCGKPVLDAVQKVRETTQQKSLGRKAREKNLAGSFRVINKEAVKGKTIVVIDDALTTGATVNALARVLLRAGAKSVAAFTFASVGLSAKK